MTGIFIIARLGSSRLKNKHLIKVNEKTFIEWLVDRFIFSFKDEIAKNNIKIFLVTSINPDNQLFNLIFSKKKEIEVFYGSDINIPLRLLQCAEENKIDQIVSIDGDDILCSTLATSFIINELNFGENIVKTIGLPLGMNAIGFKKKYLQFCLKNKINKKLETGWGKIFSDSDMKIINIDCFYDSKKIRATLDYKEDMEFFKVVIAYFDKNILKIEDDQLIKTILKKEWYKINDFLFDEYWDNFNKQKYTE